MDPLPRFLKIEKSLPDDEDPERACFFTSQDLMEATRNFEHKLGDGGYGEVYKGKLPDKRTVAVKVLKLRTQKSLEQFENEVQLLSRLRHPNVVVFYGSTIPPELLLVYEFVPNHTLKYHLHDQRLPFVWPLRLQIAIEIAQGLSYLHSATPPIIHRDVKTDNVLLDHAYHVKIADFGLSRLLPADESDVTTKTPSTAGYEDPEYRHRLKFTLKSDVYSFGVVLVELFSRKKAVDIHRGDGNIFLDGIAPTMIKNKKVGKLVDPDIGYHSYGDARRIIDSVAQLALKCLQPRGDMRLPMIEVLGVLKDINDEMQHLTVFTEMINEMHQIQGAQQEVHIYTYEELKKATKSFSRKLDRFGFNAEYLGELPDGQTVVVVKVHFRDNPNQEELFSKWANTLYRYRHQNLVAFLGCTDPHDSKWLLLLYEYVPNGDLFDHLRREQPTLTWNVRIQIGIETAEALAYIHSVRPLILHNHVTTSNILLDNAFHVKVAGLGEGDGLYPWGTADESTVQPGTVGFQDPEYRRTLRLTDKSDVYSFGVVLLELISGQMAVDVGRDEGMIFLVDLGLDKIKNNKLDELVDPTLWYHSDDDVRRMIDSVAVLACKCLEDKSNVRPTMVNVLNILKGIKDGTQLKTWSRGGWCWCCWRLNSLCLNK